MLVSGILMPSLEFTLTFTSKNEPDIKLNSLFSILTLDNKLLVSALILLETKSIVPLKTLSL